MFCSPEPDHWGHNALRPSALSHLQASSMDSFSTQGLQLYRDELSVVDWVFGVHNPAATAMARTRSLTNTVPENVVDANVNDEERRDSRSLRGGRRGLQNGPLAPSAGGSSTEESLEEPAPGGGGRGGGGGGVLSNLGACDPYHEGDDWCEAAVSPAEFRALEIQGTEMYCSRECSNRGGVRGRVSPAVDKLCV